MSSQLKTSFELVNNLGAFYTGGTMEISPSGEKVYCTCGDSVSIIDTNTGRRVSKLHNISDDKITCFVISPDFQVLVAARKSLLMHQYNVVDEKMIHKWKGAHKTPVLSMAFDKTSILLATGSSDNNIKIYDTTRQYYTHHFKVAEGSVSLVNFHPQKLILFSSSSNGNIQLWDLKMNKCLCILQGHFSTVTAIGFSFDAALMVSAGRDRVVIIWDLLQRKQVKTIPIFECIEGLVIIQSLSLKIPKSAHENQEYFVTAGERGCLRVWDLTDGKCVYADTKYLNTTKQDDVHSSAIMQLHYNSALQFLIAVTVNHNILFYHVNSMKLIKQFIGYYDEIVDLTFFGENKDFIVVASNSEEIKLIHQETSASDILHGHTGIVLSLDVSYDGKYLVSSSKDNSIRVWCKESDTNEFCCIAVGNGHTHHVGAVCWPKLSTDLLVSGSQDLTLKCWSVPQMFLKSETINLQVKWMEKAHDKDINVVCISPNDKFVVSGSQDKTAKVWQLKSGSLLGTLRGHQRGIWCALFSPVDQCIATGSADSTIRLWALSDLTCVKIFEGHLNSVLRIQFLHKGMQLISSGSEGLMKVWNIRNDECLTTIESHEGKIWALAVSTSEHMVISGGSDSTIKFWKDTTKEMKREEQEEKERITEKELELQTLILEKQFSKAVGLAILLNQPNRVLSIFREMLAQNRGSFYLEDVIHNLQTDQLESLMMFMGDWNTNVKHTYLSQSVLSTILKAITPERLIEIPHIKKTIESFLPYTERHYERINQLFQQSIFINYTWDSMKM